MMTKTLLILGAALVYASTPIDKDNFCARFSTTCGGTASKWDTCANDFKDIDAGSGEGQADTQACRIYHLKLAEAGDLNHCPHASKAGTGMCIPATKDTFCTRFAATCGGTASKWDTCANDFKDIDAGSGTGNADTQACRIFHLKLAEKGGSGALDHCPHASKAGTGMCIPATKDTFCTRFAATCGGTASKWDTCSDDFAKISAGSGTDAADTQACRIYHLKLAEKGGSGALDHCPHASKAGGGICVAKTTSDPITKDNFCARFATACGGTASKWDTCANDFKDIDAGSGEGQADTQACRIYHLKLAEAGDLSHCPHASKAGTGVCIPATKDTFCTRFTATCGKTASKWDTCADDFAKISAGSGTDAADTQACRLHHLKLAEKGGSGALDHCPHASKAGGGICVAKTTTAVKSTTTVLESVAATASSFFACLFMAIAAVLF